MDFRELDRWIERVGSARAAEQIGPLLTDSRRDSIERVLSARLDSLHVAVERPEDPYNAAAVVRSAESLGALHVHVVTEHESALHARKTTQGSFNWLHTYHHPTLDALLASVRARGARVCGGLMNGAVPLEELPVDGPVCVLFGNEKTGLSQAAIDACDLTFRIPMYGMSESMNLSVCASLAMYSWSLRRRAFLGVAGDLTGERLVQERARWFARCVDERTLRGLSR